MGHDVDCLTKLSGKTGFVDRQGLELKEFLGVFFRVMFHQMVVDVRVL